MKTKNQITKDAELLKGLVTTNVNNLIDVSKNDVKAIIDAENAEVASERLSNLLSRIDSLFSVYNENMVALPSHIYRFSYDTDAFSPITITVRSKLKANVKYSKSSVITVDEKLVESIAQVFYDGLFEMFYLNAAYENITELNGMISDICEENEIPYKFAFAVSATSTSIIETITDKEVVFNASISRALEVADLGICQSGNEYANFVHDEAVTKLVTALKAVPTTVKLLKSNVDIIKSVTGVSTKKHASKIIRGAYHKNARYIAKQKSGFAYYNETVDVNGEEVDVFSIIEKTADGNMTVILTPFDTKTLFNVEYDVIKAIKEFE